MFGIPARPGARLIIVPLPNTSRAAGSSAPKERFKEVGESAGPGAAKYFFKLFRADRSITRTASAGLWLPLTPVEIFGTAASPLILLPLRPKLVVLFSLLRLRQHFIGFIDFLEAFFSGLITGVDIRMVLASQLA